MFCKIILPSNEIHKLPAVPKTYDELHQTALKKFKNKVPEQFYFKYKDSDDELITLSNDEDLQTAVVTSEADNVKTLRIFLVSELVPQILNLNVSQPPLSGDGGDTSKSGVPINSVFSKEYIKQSSESCDNLEQSGLHKASNLSGAAMDMSKRCVSQPIHIERQSEGLEVSFDKSNYFKDNKNEQDSAGSPFNQDQLNYIGDMLEKKLREKVENKVQTVANEIVFKIIEDWRNKNPKKNQYTHTPFSARSVVPNFGMRASYRKSQTLENEELFCVECKKKIEDVKFSCLECSNYDCCETCEEKGEHAHPLLKTRLSKQSSSAKVNSLLMMANKSHSGDAYKFEEQNYQMHNADSSNSSPANNFSSQASKYSSSMAMINLNDKSSQEFQGRFQSKNLSAFHEQKGPIAGSMNQSSVMRRDYSGATPYGTPGEKEPKKYKASIIKQPLYDLINVKAGQDYNVEFTIKNTGDQAWPEDIKLYCVGGLHKGSTNDLKPLPKSDKQDVKLTLKAPNDEGRFLSQWRLQYFEDNDYKIFGSNLFVEIHVTKDKKVEPVQPEPVAKVDENPKEPAKPHLKADEDYIDENGFNARERKILKDSKCSEVVIKHVKALHDIYSDDDIQDQINFIEECPIHLDLNEIVEIYPGRTIGKKP